MAERPQVSIAELRVRKLNRPGLVQCKLTSSAKSSTMFGSPWLEPTAHTQSNKRSSALIVNPKTPSQQKNINAIIVCNF